MWPTFSFFLFLLLYLFWLAVSMKTKHQVTSVGKLLYEDVYEAFPSKLIRHRRLDHLCFVLFKTHSWVLTVYFLCVKKEPCSSFQNLDRRIELSKHFKDNAFLSFLAHSWLCAQGLVPAVLWGTICSAGDRALVNRMHGKFLIPCTIFLAQRWIFFREVFLFGIWKEISKFFSDPVLINWRVGLAVLW